MPHDIDDVELKPGDRVQIECIVRDVQFGTEFCNVTLDTLEKMFPSEYTTCIVANTKQVRKIPDLPVYES